MSEGRVCRRCGATERLERHHIKQRAYGGGDEASNLEDLCLACHDYEHAKREVVGGLRRAMASRFAHQSREKDRIWRLIFRLAVLRALNSPDVIRDRGTYTSYWTVEATRALPPPGTGERMLADSMPVGQGVLVKV